MAVSAAKGLLTRVNADVSLEVACVSELLPTVLHDICKKKQKKKHVKHVFLQVRPAVDV